MVKNTVKGVTCSAGRMSPFVAPTPAPGLVGFSRSDQQFEAHVQSIALHERREPGLDVLAHRPSLRRTEQQIGLRNGANTGLDRPPVFLGVFDDPSARLAHHTDLAESCRPE